MKNLLIICLMMLSFAVVTKAQSERDKMVLSDVKSVSVTVDVVDDNLLKESQIKYDVELELNRAGLKIYKGAPNNIYVKIRTVTNEDKSISYAIILYVDQDVMLQRDSKAKFVGTVLDIFAIYSSKSDNFNLDVRKKVLVVVDTFLKRLEKTNKTP